MKSENSCSAAKCFELGSRGTEDTPAIKTACADILPGGSL